MVRGTYLCNRRRTDEFRTWCLCICTDSAASTALVTLLAFLPTLLLSVPAGVLADRYDRRMLMMIGDGCSAIGILFIWICMMRGEAELYQICIGVLVSSFFSSLLAVSDIKLLLVIDIATFFLTVTSTAVVKKAVYETKKEKRESFGESLRIGFRAITDRKGVFMLILLSSVITCFMGVIGFLSQIGYVVAYGISGIAADGIAEKCGISVGRGAAVIVRISGLLLAVTAGCLYLTRSIRELERKK